MRLDLKFLRAILVLNLLNLCLWVTRFRPVKQLTYLVKVTLAWYPHSFTKLPNLTLWNDKGKHVVWVCGWVWMIETWYDFNEFFLNLGRVSGQVQKCVLITETSQVRVPVYHWLVISTVPFILYFLFVCSLILSIHTPRRLYGSLETGRRIKERLKLSGK